MFGKFDKILLGLISLKVGDIALVVETIFIQKFSVLVD